MVVGGLVLVCLAKKSIKTMSSQVVSKSSITIIAHFSSYLHFLLQFADRVFTSGLVLVCPVLDSPLALGLQ